MKRFCNPLTAVPALLVLGLLVAAAPTAQAVDSDISMTVSGPTSSSLGDAPLLTVDYANAGPETAVSAYINAYVPGGLPMPISILSQDAYDNLQNTAATFDGEGNMLTTTDTLGNVPFLFIDDAYCEHLLFQLQGPDDNPVQGLSSGASGSFTFNPQLPMDPPEIGKVTVYEPANMAITFRPASTGTNFLQASGSNRYSRGGNCDDDVENLCEDLEFCFGARVSEIDLIDGELELVDDGTSTPTFACLPLLNDLTGKIALMERGECQFGDKVFNAELAGAIAVFMVNDGRCGDFPSSDECVLNMDKGDVGGLATIPVMAVSITDGAPILDAVTAGTTVRMLYGPQGDSYYITGGSFLLNVGDTDPDESNNEMLFVSQVITTPDAPVAAFTFSPAEPVTGSAVTFTDESTGGAPDTWAWDFGDGGTSTEQNPMYTYTAAGTFTVSLTVTNGGGTDSITDDVTVTLPQTLVESYFIPAAAYAAGAAGSFFQTDADINNTGATDASYKFLWLPRNTNNSAPAESATFTLAAGASVRYENVLSEVFGLEEGVSGAVAVMSNSSELLIGSRTYNLPTTKVAGTFGQALPGVYYDNLIMQGETKRIIFMSENDDLRANLGCVNGMDANLRIFVDIYDDAGTMLETKTMDLGPWSNNQFNRIFSAYAPTNGYADVRSAGAGAAYYCYGSVLDNLTSDPTSILPTEYGMASTYFIAAAASAAGAAGSFFQTDVDINNAGSAMATYQFLWLPRNTNNSSPATSDSFTLAAGASVRYENVLAEVFGLEPDVSGAVAITSDSADLGVMSRTYNLPTAKVAGTFGQAIPGVPADNLIMQGETKRIIFMSENDDLRANLGCVNGIDANLRVFVDLYDDAGTMLETKTMDLAPWSNNQFNRVFSAYAPTNGYADVRSAGAGAAYYCYGSVLDNVTSDPTTILPQ